MYSKSLTYVHFSWQKKSTKKVSDQLESALAELQAQRNQHKAEVASRSSFADTGTGSVIDSERLKTVQHQLDAEIRARKAKEAELRLARTRNTRLHAMLGMASLAVLAALGSTYYYMKRKPRVVLVATPGGEGTQACSVDQNERGRGLAGYPVFG